MLRFSVRKGTWNRHWRKIKLVKMKNRARSSRWIQVSSLKLSMHFCALWFWCLANVLVFVLSSVNVLSAKQNVYKASIHYNFLEGQSDAWIFYVFTSVQWLGMVFFTSILVSCMCCSWAHINKPSTSWHCPGPGIGFASGLLEWCTCSYTRSRPYLGFEKMQNELWIIFEEPRWLKLFV